MGVHFTILDFVEKTVNYYEGFYYGNATSLLMYKIS